MKVTSNRIQELLKELGWEEVEKTTCTKYVRSIREDDVDSCAGYLHDFYYGDMHVFKDVPALRLKRPAHITRKVEKSIFAKLRIVSALEKTKLFETAYNVFVLTKNIVEKSKDPLFVSQY